MEDITDGTKGEQENPVDVKAEGKEIEKTVSKESDDEEDKPPVPEKNFSADDDKPSDNKQGENDSKDDNAEKRVDETEASPAEESLEGKDETDGKEEESGEKQNSEQEISDVKESSDKEADAEEKEDRHQSDDDKSSDDKISESKEATMEENVENTQPKENDTGNQGVVMRGKDQAVERRKEARESMDDCIEEVKKTGRGSLQQFQDPLEGVKFTDDKPERLRTVLQKLEYVQNKVGSDNDKYIVPRDGITSFVFLAKGKGAGGVTKVKR